jgi:hypothetical protein
MPKAEGADEGRLGELGITRLEVDDVTLFQSCFARDHRFAYANTWTYTTQAANCYMLGSSNLGYKICSSRMLAAVGYFPRPADGRPCFHIVNPIGSNKTDFCARICERLHTTFGAPVYVKKIDARLKASLLERAHFLDGLRSPWHTLAPLEDDTFPEIVLNLRDTFALLSLGAPNDLRDKYRRFKARNGSSDIVWRPLSPAIIDDARNIVRTFFAQYANGQMSRASDYWNMLNDERSNKRLLKEVVYIDGWPVALMIMEGIGNTSCVGLYCNLCLYREYRYLSEYVMSEMLARAAQMGFKHANLGGSETSSLHAFKQKFGHQLRTRMAHWVVYEPRCSNGQ